MKTKLLLISVAALVLTACAPMEIKKISSSFDANEAAFINKAGKNTITGSALMRQQGGGTVTCAGSPVGLTPATAYAYERMSFIYGNSNKGVRTRGNFKFEPETPSEYLTMSKSTTCNAQGFFTFKNIADGEYFVTTRVTWTISDIPQGGLLMQRVSVKNGETADIVLAP
jgi:hypothetical protein